MINNIQNAKHAPLKTFVINLDDYKENFEKQKPYLKNLGLEVHRFKAINAIKDEHLQYKNLIHPLAFTYTPKSTIGCSLSHTLLYKYIYENYNDDYYLIMEDDVYILEKYSKPHIFYNKVRETIEEVSQIDKDWEIINLITYGIVYTNNNINILSTSTCAYLINKNGLLHLKNIPVYWHHDIILSIISKKYKSSENLFYTDESFSTNRIESNTYFANIKGKVISYLLDIQGVSYTQALGYKCVRINNIEYTINDIIDFILLILLIIIILSTIYIYNTNRKK
jgi:GR25 family glycosyltransferase involved in LPS biosynthesis